MTDIQTGRRRNVRVLGREPKFFRPIQLLSHGVDAKIDPSRWVQTHGAKSFDAKGTSILRVSKHKEQDAYLVYGMRAANESGKSVIKAEAYDMIAVAGAVPGVVAKVAEHCGVSELVKQLAL
jgi:hypothetical protein